MNLKIIFKNDVSSSAFKEKCIVGKWGIISVLDDVFDIWIVQSNLDPIPYRKMAFIQKNIPVEADLHMLTGEAWFQTRDIELVRQTLPLLGIKKKRQLSPETKKKQAERLAKVRKKTPAGQAGEIEIVIKSQKDQIHYVTK